MKVTLDLSKLLDEGKITSAEHQKLVALARKQSSRHAWAALTVMSAIALVVGAVGLLPDDILARIGDFLERLYRSLGRLTWHAILFTIILGSGIRARSGFLTGLSCFVILGFLGGTTFYTHAAYFVAIREPAATVVMFSLLALLGLGISIRTQPEFERLAIVFARTCLIIVNMGFWIGSLWGSDSPLGEVADWLFSVVWACGLVCTLIWGARVGRLFVVNSAISFGAIHFYTQWFETFGAEPLPLLVGGAIGVVVAFFVPRYNRYLRKRHGATA